MCKCTRSGFRLGEYVVLAKHDGENFWSIYQRGYMTLRAANRAANNLSFEHVDMEFKTMHVPTPRKEPRHSEK